MQLKIQYWQNKDDKWTFQVVLCSNGEAIVTSGGYTHKSDMLRAIFIMTHYPIDGGTFETDNPDVNG